MSYTPPTAANFTFVGAAAYTAPANANFGWAIAPVSVRVAASSPLGAVLATMGSLLTVEAIAAASSPLGATSARATQVTVAKANATSPLGAAQAAVQIVALARAAAASPLGSCKAVSTVLRYELRGEVRLSGILVNRRVRAYSRSSGALLGEADTMIGKFKVHTGFAPIECYITPIDLASDATDWLPPTANRITSVLAMDTA